MWPQDAPSAFTFVGVLGVGGLLMQLIHLAFQRTQDGDDTPAKLRDELTRRYDDATQEIRDLRGEVDSLWDARREDHAYIDELEEYVGRLIAVLTERKINPIPSRPQRRRAREAALTDRDEVGLRKVLAERLEAEELRSLAYDLGCGELRGTTKAELARALLDFARQRQQGAALRQWLADNRPDIKE